MFKFFVYLFLPIFFSSCAIKQPKISTSATILIKTPSMKFYDRGFINRFDDYTQVQIFSAGTLILNLEIYKDKICKSSFECQSLKQFNKENLHTSYEEDFIVKFFNKSEKEIIHKDRKNKILIKIIRD